MPVDALQVAMLRRLAAEPTAESYSDADLAEILERRALDADGSGSAGYDLYAAAADVWEQKAAKLAQDYDFAADGADFKRSQAHAQALRMARLFRSQRSARSIFQTAGGAAANADSGEQP